MSKTVFILGAGASVDAGAPLMAHFLRKGEELLNTDQVSEAQKSFEAVFDGRALLTQAMPKSKIDIWNIERVFAAFEMAHLLGKFGDYDSERIENLVKSMKVFIVKTIEHSVIFYSGAVPGYYESFAELLKSVRECTKPRQTIAVITFNYDVALEYAFLRKGLRPFYGLADTKPDDAVPLLKLHGSLNWAACDKCGIVPWRIEDTFSGPGRVRLVNGDRDKFIIPIGSDVSSLPHGQNHSLATEPVIVPPTWNKYEHYRGIAKVWAWAAQELTEAENIIIIGYSFPDSDFFFTYLYALGTISKTILKRFWVFDCNKEVPARFKTILGQSAEHVFQVAGQRGGDWPNSFQDAIPFIRGQLLEDSGRLTF